MPAHVPGPDGDPGAFGLKSVSFFPGNEHTGVPTHLATILLLDPRTGGLVAILDGRLITEMRTAAVSAVSVEALARPGDITLAILGSGVQAHSHLAAIRAVRTVRHVRVWSRQHEHAIQFVRHHLAKVSYPLSAVGTPAEAMNGADVVVTATSATDPVVTADLLKPGMHLAVVGSSSANRRELDGPAVKRCRVWVDSRDAAQVEAGDLIIAMREGHFDERHVVGELGDALAGRSGRQNAQDITMFKSLGIGVEDVATAHMVVQRARAQRLGREASV